MENSLVTIAIPAYKATFLRETIESALAQTYTNIEVIVVDDKSPYHLQEIVESINDSRLHYYRNEENIGNENPANNWNKCLSYAHGTFFSLLCDDDLYEPTFIECMVKLAQQYPDTNVFRARADIIDKDGNTIDWYPNAPVWENADDYVWHVNRRCRKQTISEFMYRTAHIRELGGYSNLPLAWYADYASVFRFSLKGGIASTPDILMHFRQSGQNISSIDERNIMEKLHAISQYVKWLTGFIFQNHLHKSILHIGNLRDSVMIEQEWILRHSSKWTLLKVFFHKKRLMVHSCSIRKAL